MEITFSYIRNRISEHKKIELLDYCYKLLEVTKDQHTPIWFVFLLMKWTYLYGETKYPSKKLTPDKFSRLLNLITNFNEEHITDFMKKGTVKKAFNILHSQQFYLQKAVYTETYATQLKLYNSLSGKKDINKLFLEESKLSVFDFIYILQVMWLYINADDLKNYSLKFDGYLSIDYMNIIAELVGQEKLHYFLNLMVLDPVDTNNKINEFKKNIKKEELQSLETTFFTMYPFQVYNNQIRLIHKSIFNHVVNYYVYDFLKSKYGNLFTTEFGDRFEKYIELGIQEVSLNYKNEIELKKMLPKNSNLIDFFIEDYNVFIECKAIEIQPYPSINPTDKIIFNALKDSILKAYFKQLLTVSKEISPKDENWGIIITYKELFWSDCRELYELGKDRFEGEIDIKYLPPENVYIIDIYTWDKIIQIIKDKKATLLEIFEKVKLNNSKPETSKQLFNMHLDEYKLKNINLSYLKNEKEQLQIVR